MIEQGNHDALMRTDSVYKRLVMKQESEGDTAQAIEAKPVPGYRRAGRTEVVSVREVVAMI